MMKTRFMMLASLAVLTSSCQDESVYMYYRTPRYDAALFENKSLPERNSPIIELTPRERKAFREIEKCCEERMAPAPTILFLDPPDVGRYVICDKEGNEIDWGGRWGGSFITYTGEKGSVICGRLEPIDPHTEDEDELLWMRLKPELMPAFLRAWKVNPEVIQTERQKKEKRRKKKR